MTFEGHPIIYWPDVERHLQELDPSFRTTTMPCAHSYRDLYALYEPSSSRTR